MRKIYINILMVGISLLGINFKVGYNFDEVNYLAFLFRSSTWFIISIIIFLLTINSVKKLKFFYLNNILFLPILYLLLILIASILAYLIYGTFIDIHGFNNLILTIISIFVSYLIFDYTVNCDNDRKFLFCIFLATTPNIFAFFLTFIINIPHISIFGNDINFLSNGYRFQGFSSNPNIIAISFLSPLILLSYGSLIPLKPFYAIALKIIFMIIIVSTGVRATILSIFIIYILNIILGLDKVKNIFFNFVLLIFAFIFITFFDNEILLMINDRISNSDDGRFLIWSYYINYLLANPLGYGFGFESLLNADNIIPGLRLPPHNMFITAGLYGGFLAVFVVVYRLYIIVSFIKYRSNTNLLCLVYCNLAIAINLLFYGDIMSDFNFSILFSLMLASLYKSRNT